MRRASWWTCFILLLLPFSTSFAGEWRDSQRLRDAIALLDKSSPSGRELLEKAQAMWGAHSNSELTHEGYVRWGDASRTDAVLVRHFDPSTGAETRERKITVYLRAEQSLGDVILDLAHELVHATSRPAWDPYDPQLTAGKYIHAAIEGEGGEVVAVQGECKVAREIESTFDLAGLKGPRERCNSYWKLSQAKVTQAIRSDFYRVGRWKTGLLSELGNEASLFPSLSGERPRLYSSTGGTPYPVALLTEFQEMTEAACENSRKRAESGSESSSSFMGMGMSIGFSRHRAPASSTTSDFLSHRCQFKP